MSKILELYEENKNALGIDKISFEAAENAKTPYTTNDLKKADEQVLNAAKLKVGRGGELNAVKYTDITPRR